MSLPDAVVVTDTRVSDPAWDPWVGYQYPVQEHDREADREMVELMTTGDTRDWMEERT
jgi:hypothetical protein